MSVAYFAIAIVMARIITIPTDRRKNSDSYRFEIFLDFFNIISFHIFFLLPADADNMVGGLRLVTIF